jgi:uncharacterized protein (DUF488 family)
MMFGTETATVCTIGYENVAQPTFLDHLRNSGVRLVVDVRAIANSRRPGYAKRALSAGLADAAIGYVHLKALGTPAAGREAARTGQYDRLRQIYDQHLQTPEAESALGLLAEQAREAPVCLLCLEADPAHCHRVQIAEALHTRWGFSVRHLHPSAAPALICR